jgi:hypothetical protein
MKNTKEIENKIGALIRQSEFANDLEILLNSFYYFTDEIELPGVYVYSENQSYYLISVGDRGNVGEKEEYTDADSLIKEILWGLESSLSAKLARGIKGNSFRKTMFAKRIEISRTIGEVYSKDAEDRISCILKESPYEE